LIRGLRNPATKSITIGTLALFVEISSKSMADLNGGYVDQAILGFLTPLFPVIDMQELRDLLLIFGVEIHSARETVEDFDLYRRLFAALQLNDRKPVAVILVATVISLLESVEYESEALFLYNFLAECATHIPDVVALMYDRLFPKMTNVLTTSHAASTLNACQRILLLLVNSSASAKVGGDAPNSSAAMLADDQRSDSNETDTTEYNNESSSGRQSASSSAINLPAPSIRKIAIGSQPFATQVSTGISTTFRLSDSSPTALQKQTSRHPSTSNITDSRDRTDQSVAIQKRQPKSVQTLQTLGFSGLFASDISGFINVPVPKKLEIAGLVSQLVSEIILAYNR
jgi:hypothetical protein